MVGNNIVVLSILIKLNFIRRKLMDLQSFVYNFNEVESTMYQIKEGDWEEEVSSRERKLMNEIIELSKYIAENYSKNEF